MLPHFQGRDFLKLADFTPEEVGCFVDTAIELKRKRATGEVFEPLRGKTFAMIFEKLSTRTRVSFQAGAAQLGAQTFYMSPDQMQTSRGEPIRGAARIIDRSCDGRLTREGRRGFRPPPFAVSSVVTCERDDADQSTFGSFAIDAAIASSGWS